MKALITLVAIALTIPAFASEPIGYAPVMLQYINGELVALKAAGAPTTTKAECLDSAAGLVAKILEGAPQGAEAIVACLPVPPSPSNQHTTVKSRLEYEHVPIADTKADVAPTDPDTTVAVTVIKYCGDIIAIMNHHASGYEVIRASSMPIKKLDELIDTLRKVQQEGGPVYYLELSDTGCAKT